MGCSSSSSSGLLVVAAVVVVSGLALAVSAVVVVPALAALACLHQKIYMRFSGQTPAPAPDSVVWSFDVCFRLMCPEASPEEWQTLTRMI